MEERLVFFVERANYVVSFLLMVVGLFIVVVNDSRVRRLIGLCIYQSSVLLFYISLGYVGGASVPILSPGSEVVYNNPLPSVLMLTAIVVGVATMAVGLAMVIMIEARDS